MSKLVEFNMMSLDGFFEAPDHDLSWHNVDDEFNDFAIQQLHASDVLLFGRVTYEMMASYWPNAEEDDPIVARLMNSMPKIVFSQTLPSAGWNNTRMVKSDIEGEIRKLKQEPGKELLLLGSADLGATLEKSGLIDEYRVMVNPVILGRGTPLFKDNQRKLDLRLIQSRSFQNGNVLLTYQAAERQPRQG